MNATDAVSFEAFRKALTLAAQRVCDAREDLCALDAVAGDGDLGTTLATGFMAVHDFIAVWDEPDVGAALMRIGACLQRRAPSTIGTLLASAFLRSGRGLLGAANLHPVDAASMLRAAAEAVAELGGAATGERTVLDAMGPAAAAAERADSEGATVIETFQLAAAAARAGAHATAEMEPIHGRAGWIGERARGRPDAGATAWAIYVTGLAEALGGSQDENPLLRT